MLDAACHRESSPLRPGRRCRRDQAVGTAARACATSSRTHGRRAQLQMAAADAADDEGLKVTSVVIDEDVAGPGLAVHRRPCGVGATVLAGRDRSHGAAASRAGRDLARSPNGPRGQRSLPGWRRPLLMAFRRLQAGDLRLPEGQIELAAHRDPRLSPAPAALSSARRGGGRRDVDEAVISDLKAKERIESPRRRHAWGDSAPRALHV